MLFNSLSFTIFLPIVFAAYWCIVNIDFLGSFKYLNFVAESFDRQPASFSFKTHPDTLNIISPAGDSFYDFHGHFFVSDVHNRKTVHITDFTDYSSWISFFPLLSNFNKTGLLPSSLFSDKSRLTQKSTNAFDNKLMETSEKKSW